MNRPGPPESRIFSSHLPVADGTSLDEFLKVLAAVPDAEPFMPPDAEQFTQLIEQMAVMQRAESTAAAH